MEAIAHSPSFAKKVGVPQSVGKDFSNADKGKSFKRGGDMATKMNSGFMAMIAKKKDEAKGKPMKKMAKGGSASSRADGVATKGKTKGTFVAMKKGGMSC